MTLTLAHDFHMKRVPHQRDLRARQELLGQLGLEHDPFEYGVAENELAANDRYSTFYSYYVPAPLYPTPDVDALRELRQPRQAFIFGKIGSGKTTLRAVLESDLRTRSARHLVITYYLGDAQTERIPPEKHWNALARVWALDLFIQVVERFNPLNATPNAKQIESLREAVAIGGRPLQFLLRRILDYPVPRDPKGYGSYFPLVGRFAAQYVPDTTALRELLSQVRAHTITEVETRTGTDALEELYLAAKRWEFEEVVILVDGVDNLTQDPQEMVEMLKPLLVQLQVWQKKKMFAKFFLPIALRDRLSNFAARGLKQDYFAATIHWDEAALRGMLTQRFRAARSRLVSFDQLAEGAGGKNLTRKIIKESDGTPRATLRGASDLLSSGIFLQTQTRPADGFTNKHIAIARALPEPTRKIHQASG